MSTPDPVTAYYRADRVPDADLRTLALSMLLTERHDWPRLQTMVNEYGGVDIVVRVDGGYSPDDADRVLTDYATQAAAIQTRLRAIKPWAA